MRNTEKHYENNTREEECGDYVKEKNVQEVHTYLISAL